MLKPWLQILPYFIVVRLAKGLSVINLPPASGLTGYKAVTPFRGQMLAWKDLNAGKGAE